MKNKLPVYLDYAATTPIDPRVIEKMLLFMGPASEFGNPSSSHSYGRNAARAIEEARDAVASLINALYQKIWTTEGSPLLIHSQRLVKKIEQQLIEIASAPIKVALGMRYGEPSISSALGDLQKQGVERLLIIPLYPKYAAATTGATFDAVMNTLKTWRYIPEIRWINHYFAESSYINAIADTIKQQFSPQLGNHLLFSFHGLPVRCIEKGDPYQKQCQATVNLITRQLQLSSDQWSLVYQSRFGRAKWLEPYCDATLRELAQQGKKNVTVICPGFAVDCLETLEEIEQLNRNIFLRAGGKSFHYIPALNDSSAHVNVMLTIIRQHTQGWCSL